MDDLRRQAEAHVEDPPLGLSGAVADSWSRADAERLLHEIDVQRVELELQNQELVEARLAMEAALDRYVELYDSAPVGYVTLTADGFISEVNLAGAEVLGRERSRLVNRDLKALVSHRSLMTFEKFLGQVFTGASVGDAAPVRCELSLSGETPRTLEVSGGLARRDRKCLAITTDGTEARRREDAGRARAHGWPLRADEAEMVGDSAIMAELTQHLSKIAECPASTVLITGESGTGKDLAARFVHLHSRRRGAPFVNITCSALPEALLESELFGHERGAFTGADQLKRGLVEQADGGTLFLDEIGEMTLALQAKLLRFLEEKRFRRVGGTADIRVDVRLVAATNRDLEVAVRRRTFREDLYYRLHVVPVVMPPLRERTGDVRPLAEHFITRLSRELDKRIVGLGPGALAALEAYAWPGNVRELKNAVEHAMILAEGDRLEAKDFRLSAQVLGEDGFRLPDKGVDLLGLERSLLVQALGRTHGNQTRAAALLGLKRDQVRSRMEKFGLRAHPESEEDGSER